MQNVKIEFWSIYSFWSCCIQNNFTKSIDSNQFLKIFLQKAFAIVFVQKCYSYEINVINSNWLWFKIAISWLEIWNEIVRIQRNIIFQIDFFIAINHAKFLATTFDDNVNKIRREKFIDAIVYCLLSNSLYDLFENDQLIQLLNNSMIVFFLINFCKINIFVVETSFIQCILIDFLLILSNVNFLSFFDLKLYCIRINFRTCVFIKVVMWFLTKTFCHVFVEIVVFSIIDDVVRILIFDILQKEQNDRNCCFRVVFQWFECKKFFLHECFDKLRKFFNCFDVFDLWLLL